MNNMRIITALVAPLALFLGVAPAPRAAAEDATVTLVDTTQWPPEQSLIRETAAAVDRSVDYLAARQHEAGHWSDATFPALTALPLWALLDSGYDNPDVIEPAVEFLLSCVRENGGIYQTPSFERKGGGLKNYNTAICMIALHKVGDPALVPVIQKARAYLADSQHLGGDVYHGGMGYDPDTGRAYTDLSNSYIAYEAMRMTEEVEDLRGKGEERADLDWEAAREFIERVHNDPDFNEASWASDDPAQKGGFAYHPENTRGGTFTNEEGVVKFRSFGSMTYAGMLSYIYAEVDRDDPRVQSTFNWIRRNWDLDANINAGREGLYYYYNVLAKGLNAYGQNKIDPPDAEPFIWRTEYLEKLLSLQKIEADSGQGYWVNEVGRYWENNPILVTAYALIGLQYALGEDPAR